MLLKLIVPSDEQVDQVINRVPCMLSDNDVYVPTDCTAELVELGINFETVGTHPVDMQEDLEQHF